MKRSGIEGDLGSMKKCLDSAALHRGYGCTRCPTDVASMKRSAIEGDLGSMKKGLDSAALHRGYDIWIGHRQRPKSRTPCRSRVALSAT